MDKQYLPEVESFAPFTDLPEYRFGEDAHTVFGSQDIIVRMLEAGHYVVYRIRYVMMPEGFSETYTDIVYDLDELRQNKRKVYKIFDALGNEMTLGQGTYDVGLLFSGGRVYADKHFRKVYWEGQP